MRKLLVLAMVAPLGAAGFLMAGLATAAGMGSGTGFGSGMAPAAGARIAPAMLSLYVAAGSGACPSMPWEVLAAIGTVESDNGASTAPGVQSGTNPAGAEGAMQFEAGTFAEYARPVPPGGADPPSPYDVTDAVWAAARMLCASGAAGGHLQAAIYAYNHSEAYVARVWRLAVSYGMAPDGSSDGGGAPVAGMAASPGATYAGDVRVVLAAALSQLGVAYVYGGDTPGVALDCSGLVDFAYRSAGIVLPRTTFAQVAAGVAVPVERLVPGDLVFFAGGQPVEAFGHVGIYLGAGEMIDAPHRGSVVSITGFRPGSVEAARRILVEPGGSP